MSVVYVLDTSWILEIYRVQGKHDPTKADAIQHRFAQASSEGAAFILPIAVLLETCNHIAQVPDGNKRRTLAHAIWRAVQQSRQQEGVPFLIEPATSLPEFDTDIEVFARINASQGIGLTDTQIIRIAIEWKSKPGYRVHIWSFDEALKAREPDSEANPIS